eukprot:5253717-Amphidinium_carterae.1
MRPAAMVCIKSISSHPLWPALGPFPRFGCLELRPRHSTCCFSYWIHSSRVHFLSSCRVADAAHAAVCVAAGSVADAAHAAVCLAAGSVVE